MASDAGYMPPLAPTKAEHDAWVAAHGRPYTQQLVSIRHPRTEQPQKAGKQ